MYFSLKEIPFSRYGSYAALSEDREGGKIYIRDFHGGDGAPTNLFVFELPEGAELSASETKTAIRSQNGDFAIFVMGENDSIHIKIKGMRLKLMQIGSRYDSIVPVSASKFEAYFYKKNRKTMFVAARGRCEKFGNWSGVGEKEGGIVLNSDGGDAYIIIENYMATWKSESSYNFEKTCEKLDEEFSLWRKSWNLPAKSHESINPEDLAVYLLWANVVRAKGILKHDALYCSKNWMNNIWSWDNCFMAIALSPNFPKLAYYQLKIFFHVQDESGCYPDYANDVFASFSCCKPPIHAWAFREMRSLNPELRCKTMLKEAYKSFKKVTDYWLLNRIPEGHGLPSYNHGNDSGWDNSTVFKKGVPVISPDLTAHIIRQLDILSLFAKELDEPGESEELSKKADGLFAKLTEELFDGKRFFAIHVPTGERIKEGDSLLTYLPIVLGYRMKKEKLDFLVQEMIDKFEGTYGLCTENPNGYFYKKGGYWLGPIWAPVTYLIIDALEECGHGTHAKRLAGKFIALAEIGLMAENFDAFSGEGFDDFAFSWTSAVYLHLKRRFGSTVML